ncbi:MAG TPA: thioredoxin-dependent thiol peroxidase [Methanospirillum sp.]|uniref:thioredoxin-dependent thiol peroxidase n=1 Tax=Methanospirillum sp. TaxID=45200 RepID=UPI002C6CC505|nr:thioredoxin-dependent thiol peroxidase [Methanospirillum sp.]HWQ64267.1 thioredoxin-dependent thiol peroxidase [Methanospirillum sp.]
MPQLSPGDKAPEFALPDQDGKIHSSEEFRGSWIILYFYPKDNTSACTAEALAFSAVYEELSEIGVPVVGISPDTVESHQKFVEKHDLHLTLLADPLHNVIEAYGVWTLKKMYGREYMGVERSTFLINPNGIIEDIWHKVKVKGHVEAVSSRLRELMADEKQ